MKRRDVLKGLAVLPFLPAARRAFAALGNLQEAPFFAERVANGELPPLAKRLPKSPLIVDLPARGRVIGKPGGEMTTLIARARDIHYFTANEYTRLVGYDEKLKLQSDIAAAGRAHAGGRADHRQFVTSKLAAAPAVRRESRVTL